ncbi:hypothetical protein BDK51DRAFT_34539 [Blyttiomyces helicus]|uniref:C2H2-type domain-containing protein n=1 Tax=Blyttiomyces helicus TaxID=388810 RepID=A0A4P9WFY4_9FUNG|nr:hypothetical protein BDK51DRAFT_34539 [Blyttiomyces helicus]|eukprot:RKO91699.1 hypothetical protein BDK51DRAFT_34539 [Blyttiomyces helicus]
MAHPHHHYYPLKRDAGDPPTSSAPESPKRRRLDSSLSPVPVAPSPPSLASDMEEDARSSLSEERAPAGDRAPSVAPALDAAPEPAAAANATDSSTSVTTATTTQTAAPAPPPTTEPNPFPIGLQPPTDEDKPYLCIYAECGKRYKKLNGLVSHHHQTHVVFTVPGDQKPFKCTVGGCDKAYKNSNGLAYHLETAHIAVAAGTTGAAPLQSALPRLLAPAPLPQPAVPQPAAKLPSAQRPAKIVVPKKEREVDDAKKPFVCPFSDCTKAYKNPNGLAYHLTKGKAGHNVSEADLPAILRGAMENSPLPDDYSEETPEKEDIPAPQPDNPFTCRTCLRSFSSNSSLEYHRAMIHSHRPTLPTPAPAAAAPTPVPTPAPAAVPTPTTAAANPPAPATPSARKRQRPSTSEPHVADIDQDANYDARHPHHPAHYSTWRPYYDNETPTETEAAV